jgi:hypothetical protein
MSSEAYAPCSASSTAVTALRAAKAGWKYISLPPVCGHWLSPLEVLAAIDSAAVAAPSLSRSSVAPASAAASGLTSPVGRCSLARSAVISARPMRPPAS